MGKHTEAFYQKAEGIAYSSLQHMPGLESIDTVRETNPHDRGVLRVTFEIDRRNKRMEDQKRALLFHLFDKHDEFWLSGIDNTSMTIVERL